MGRAGTMGKQAQLDRQAKESPLYHSVCHRLRKQILTNCFGVWYKPTLPRTVRDRSIIERSRSKEGSSHMSKQQVTAKLQDSPLSATAEYDFGDNLAEARELFGDEVVFSRAKASLVIDVQAYIRALLKQDPPKEAEEIAKLVSEWRPGVKARGKTLEEKIAHLFGQLSEEKKAELLSRYMDDVG